jgi:hypothetical protein
MNSASHLANRRFDRIEIWPQFVPGYSGQLLDAKHPLRRDFATDLPPAHGLIADSHQASEFSNAPNLVGGDLDDVGCFCCCGVFHCRVNYNYQLSLVNNRQL